MYTLHCQDHSLRRGRHSSNFSTPRDLVHRFYNSSVAAVRRLSLMSMTTNCARGGAGLCSHAYGRAGACTHTDAHAHKRHLQQCSTRQEPWPSVKPSAHDSFLALTRLSTPYMGNGAGVFGTPSVLTVSSNGRLPRDVGFLAAGAHSEEVQTEKMQKMQNKIGHDTHAHTMTHDITHAHKHSVTAVNAISYVHIHGIGGTRAGQSRKGGGWENVRAHARKTPCLCVRVCLRVRTLVCTCVRAHIAHTHTTRSRALAQYGQRRKHARMAPPAAEERAGLESEVHLELWSTADDVSSSIISARSPCAIECCMSTCIQSSRVYFRKHVRVHVRFVHAHTHTHTHTHTWTQGACESDTCGARD